MSNNKFWKMLAQEMVMSRFIDGLTEIQVCGSVPSSEKFFQKPPFFVKERCLIKKTAR